MFQYSLGNGILILFGSFRKSKENMEKHCIAIPTTVFICGILSAISVFMYVGHLAHKKNIAISDMNLSGAELTFVIFPMALNLMPFGNLWAVMFFFMMVCLGLDSMFAYVEYQCNTFEDLFKHYRK
jgi:solute carrier family 6 (neurotransmitter transporter, taurine) member 6